MIWPDSQPTQGIQPTAYVASSKPYRTHGSMAWYAHSNVPVSDWGAGAGPDGGAGNAWLALGGTMNRSAHPTRRFSRSVTASGCTCAARRTGGDAICATGAGAATGLGS